MCPCTSVKLQLCEICCQFQTWKLFQSEGKVVFPRYNVYIVVYLRMARLIINLMVFYLNIHSFIYHSIGTQDLITQCTIDAANSWLRHTHTHTNYLSFLERSYEVSYKGPQVCLQIYKQPQFERTRERSHIQLMLQTFPGSVARRHMLQHLNERHLF